MNSVITEISALKYHLSCIATLQYALIRGAVTETGTKTTEEERQKGKSTHLQGNGLTGQCLNEDLHVVT
jgi:hypothetical protein